MRKCTKRWLLPVCAAAMTLAAGFSSLAAETVKVTVPNVTVSYTHLAGYGISLNNDSMNPPHHVPGDSQFVQTLLKSYEMYTGRKGECIAIGGGTYVHHLKNGVAFGAAMPETENNMHGPDEFAVIDELLMSAKIFAQVITELCC